MIKKNDQANLIAGALEIMSGYLGKLTTGNSAYIRDVETGARLGPGEVGEICVKTMICMKVLVMLNIYVFGLFYFMVPKRISSERAMMCF